MTEHENIFNPIDDTLEARIDAYKRVHEDWLNAEASLKSLENDEWDDTLGDRAEVEKALDITTSSLYFGAGSFTQEEIFAASDAQLIQSDEAQQLLEHKRYYELQKLRNAEDQNSDRFENSR